MLKKKERIGLFLTKRHILSVFYVPGSVLSADLKPPNILEEPDIKSPTSVGSWKKQGDLKKTSASLTMLKLLTVWIRTNCGKFFKRWEYQTNLPASWETCMQVKKQQLEQDMEQQTGSNLGKESIKAVCHHPAYLTSIWSTSCEMLG